MGKRGGTRGGGEWEKMPRGGSVSAAIREAWGDKKGVILNGYSFILLTRTKKVDERAKRVWGL